MGGEPELDQPMGTLKATFQNRDPGCQARPLRFAGRTGRPFIDALRAMSHRMLGMMPAAVYAVHGGGEVLRDGTGVSRDEGARRHARRGDGARRYRIGRLP